MNTTEMALVLRKGFSCVNETVLTIGLSRIDGIYKEYKQYLENTPRGQRSHDEPVMICGGVGNYRRFIEGNLSIVKEKAYTASQSLKQRQMLIMGLLVFSL